MMSLLELALADRNLLAAWQRVSDNDGAPGADGVTLDVFGANLMQRLSALRAQVREGRYHPQPLLEVALERPGKSPRLLGIPAVRDRVLQTAVALILTPVLEPHFETASYGYRPGRSVSQAVERVIAGRMRGYRWVVDADIHGYFDNIPHEALIAGLTPHLADQTLLPLIRQWLAAPVKTADGIRKRAVGIAQGSPISPLFANLYLDPFDEAIAADPARWLVRYADDFVILCKTQDEAEQALEAASLWLERAGLTLNFDKTRITTFANGFDFLGVRFEGDTQWALAPEASPWVLPPRLRPTLPVSPGGTGKSMRAAQHPPTPLPKIAMPAPEAPDEAPSAPGIGIDAPPLLRTLYVTEPGAYLHREGERIVVSRDGEDILSVPIEKIDQVFIASEGAISFGVLRALLRRRAPVFVGSAAGEPLGAFRDELAGHVALRRKQFERAADPEFRLAAARAIIAAKIANGRLLLRRYFRFRHAKLNAHDEALAELRHAVERAGTIEAARGLEGAAARHHFEGMRELLAPQWRFDGRSRQPPQDPVNALLSYGYGMLYHTMLTLVCRCGLDPHIGSLHAEREGHASLVSDLIEEFRPLVVDAVVLKLLLSGKAKPDDFEYGHAEYPVRLGAELRRRFIGAIEAKLGSPITHPASGKLLDYRRAMLWQVTHWSDVVSGGEPAYRPFVLR